MVTVLIRGDRRWADQIDDLGGRLSLPRTAVIERAVALLMRAEGIEPLPRMRPSKFHPWIGRRSTPGPGARRPRV